MHDLTIVPSLIGGILIGVAAALLMLFNGRIAGISGILGGLLKGARGSDARWRGAFVGGLVAGGLVMAALRPDLFANDLGRSLPFVVVAGLLVGFGTRLGSGCTSGHGVCGISRLSPRSLVATLAFMATGLLGAWIGHALDGEPSRTTGEPTHEVAPAETEARAPGAPDGEHHPMAIHIPALSGR
ncbi:MAG: YeeE/YedE family protein [Myxococcota bacterium]